MKLLIQTVGLPRSGKSTWCQEKIKEGIPVVNPDSIRLALHGKAYDPDYEKEVWHIVKIMIKSLFLAGHNTVILDATAVHIKSRNQWLSPDWECKYKCFDTPVEECVRRAEVNGQDYLISVIYRMNRDLVWPTENLYVETK